LSPPQPTQVSVVALQIGLAPVHAEALVGEHCTQVFVLVSHAGLLGS
jgi:hypothetical protein